MAREDADALDEWADSAYENCALSDIGGSVPLVRAAFFAAADRSLAVRRDAARLAWRDSAPWETVLCGSRFNARDTARDTRGRRRGLRLC
jgi:hypothetical protein